MTITPAQAQIATGVASVIFSGVLVIVTYLYYRETQEHTEEMKAAREAEFKPVLKGTIEPSLGLHNRFVFENTGKGAAHDVTARWGFIHLDEEIEWSLPLVSSGQRHKFSLPFTDELNNISTREQIEDELDGADGTLYFEWECTDSLGNNVSNREEIDVLDSIRKRHGLEYVQKDEQREIRKELENLTDSINDIPKSVESTHIEAEKIDVIVQKIQKMETAQRSQIQKLTGLPSHEVASILSSLKEARIVEYDFEGNTTWFSADASDTVIEWIGYNES